MGNTSTKHQHKFVMLFMNLNPSLLRCDQQTFVLTFCSICGLVKEVIECGDQDKYFIYFSFSSMSSKTNGQGF